MSCCYRYPRPFSYCYPRSIYPRYVCERGPRGWPGRSAYEIALENGFIGTKAQWLESLRCQPRPFLSSYIEVLGNQQNVAQNARVVFDPDTVDIVGNNISINSAGTVFTIYRTGLYKVDWNVNLTSISGSAVMGILENGEPASGSSTSNYGNFASGTLINVTTVPFTVSLFNYGSPISIGNPPAWEASAASIRITRFADGPAV